MSINLYLRSSKEKNADECALYQMNTEQTQKILAVADPRDRLYSVRVMDAYMIEVRGRYPTKDSVLALIGHELNVMRFLLMHPDHVWLSY